MSRATALYVAFYAVLLLFHAVKPDLVSVDDDQAIPMIGKLFTDREPTASAKKKTVVEYNYKTTNIQWNDLTTTSIPLADVTATSAPLPDTTTIEIEVITVPSTAADPANDNINVELLADYLKIASDSLGFAMKMLDAINATAENVSDDLVKSVRDDIGKASSGIDGATNKIEQVLSKNSTSLIGDDPDADGGSPLVSNDEKPSSNENAGKSRLPGPNKDSEETESESKFDGIIDTINSKASDALKFGRPDSNTTQDGDATGDTIKPNFKYPEPYKDVSDQKSLATPQDLLENNTTETVEDSWSIFDTIKNKTTSFFGCLKDLLSGEDEEDIDTLETNHVEGTETKTPADETQVDMMETLNDLEEGQDDYDDGEDEEEDEEDDGALKQIFGKVLETNEI